MLRVIITSFQKFKNYRIVFVLNKISIFLINYELKLYIYIFLIQIIFNTYYFSYYIVPIMLETNM